MQSEPDRRAAQPQRVQQQVQIQIAIHNDNVAIVPGRVKWFLNRPLSVCPAGKNSR